jgi:hypothetical protein
VPEVRILDWCKVLAVWLQLGEIAVGDGSVSVRKMVN